MVSFCYFEDYETKNISVLSDALIKKLEIFEKK